MAEPFEPFLSDDLFLLDLESLPLAADDDPDPEWLSNKDAFPSVDTSLFMQPSYTVPTSVSSSVVPVKPRSRGRRRRRSDLCSFSDAAAAAAAEAVKKKSSKEKRRCRHCDAEETPQWRAGPEGPKTLCNACGVRYKSGRLVPEYRPAASPSFSPALHSNSHRRILEMRRRRRGGAAS